MSKRKQMRPSKFGAGKKGSDHSNPIDESEKEHNQESDEEFRQGEAIQSTDDDHGSGNGDSNVEKTVAAVAQTSFVSSVIQRTGRRRALSAGITSSSGQYTESNEAVESGMDGSGINTFIGAGKRPQGDRVQADDYPKRLRLGTVSGWRNIVFPERQKFETGTAANVIERLHQREFMKTLMCQYCETRFSNPSTLEAHQTIYCTKRPTDKELSSNTESVIKASPSLADTSNGIKALPLLAGTSNGTTIKDHSNGITIDDPQRPQVIRNHRTTSTDANIHLISSINASSSFPSVILFPVAYTRSNVIQVLGKPQTIVPVAIPASSHTSDFVVNPILLEEDWCSGINIPDMDLPISNAVSNDAASKPKNFSLSLAIRGGNSDGKTKLLEERTRSQGKEARSPPLDLTRKTSPSPANPWSDVTQSKHPSTSVLNAASNSNHSTMQQAEGENASVKEVSSASANVYQKNYACSKCGVAFSSKKTLEGHQAYYCKAASTGSLLPSTSPENGLFSSTNPQSLSCQYCDHVAMSAWQLVQHMKTEHSLGSAYICTMCGYRGFSMRGMKSHLKHAHTTDGILTYEEAYLSKYVKKTELFADYEGREDLCASNSSSNGEITVDDPGKEKRDSPPGMVKSNRRREQNSSTNGQRISDDGQRAATSPAGGSKLASKYEYACHFCVYKSPYKGNVKRHLALVHKIDKQKG